MHGQKKPVGMIDAAGKIPVPLEAIAAIDGIGPAEWPQRASTAKVGWLAAESAPDLGRKPTQRERHVSGDHRAPTNRAVGL
jgi:hypothetical protein